VASQLDRMSIEQLEDMMGNPDISEETLLYVDEVLNHRYQDDPGYIAASHDDMSPKWSFPLKTGIW
jgi:hypothetical protein